MGPVTGSVDALVETRLFVDDRAIEAYAEITQDFNPLHLDPAFAAGTPMGGVIAHGTMSLALVWQSLVETFGTDATGGVTLEARFVRPVRPGGWIVAGGRRRSEESPDFDVWVRLDDGQDALQGTLGPLPPGAGQYEPSFRV